MLYEAINRLVLFRIEESCSETAIMVLSVVVHGCVIFIWQCHCPGEENSVNGLADQLFHVSTWHNN